MTVPLMVPVVNCANAGRCQHKVASKTNPTTRRADIPLTTTKFVSIGFMAASMSRIMSLPLGKCAGYFDQQDPALAWQCAELKQLGDG
jgi:hypothetical protein